MKKWTLSSLLFLLLGFNVSAQDIPMGAWRTHFSYNNARVLTASGTKLYCAVENGLFSLDLKDQSVNKISKLNGLSGTGITAMQYNGEANVLVIGYESGLIDLVYENQIKTIRDIQNLRNISAKQIRDIEIHDGFVYAATEVGIIVISLQENGIVDNFRSIGEGAADLPVYEILIADQTLYAITSAGVQFGLLSQNLLDFNNWTLLDLNSSFAFRNLTNANDKVFLVGNNSTVSVLENDTLRTVVNLVTSIKSLRVVDDQLGILTDSEYYSFQSTSGSGTLVLQKEFESAKNLNDLIFTGTLWFADGAYGLMNEEENSIIPNGPISDNMTNIKLVDQKLYAFYGPKPSAFDSSYDSLGYDTFTKASWSNTIIPDFYNIVDVASYKDQLYFASTGKGIYSVGDQSILNQSNSILANNTDGTGVLISSLAAAASLWATSYDNNFPLVSLNSNDEWSGYLASTIGTSLPESVTVSQRDVLWITRGEGSVSTHYLEDNKYRLLTSASGLPSNTVLDIAIDVNDEAWVATSLGVVNFADASFIFEDIQGTPIVYDDEQVYHDFEIKAVATDGGGRIWVGAKGYLAVYSNNLVSRDFYFDETNSPLPSGDILNLEYNEQNGEMFILTSRGLVSYRSNSSAENNNHRNVSIFPNPVRPEYNGLVGIKGVVSNADIRITDINGKLIQRINANGGTASWNLRDYANSRVKAGVYLVFSSSIDGSETFVGKIAIVD